VETTAQAETPAVPKKKKSNLGSWIAAGVLLAGGAIFALVMKMRDDDKSRRWHVERAAAMERRANESGTGPRVTIRAVGDDAMTLEIGTPLCHRQMLATLLMDGSLKGAWHRIEYIGGDPSLEIR
jgi:hypothetical protein